MIDSREAFLEMERVLSRRTFFKRVLKGAGAIAALDRFGPSLFGQAQTPDDMFNHGLQIVSAFGRLVIPVDQDPGWATFEPDITQYTLDVYIRQVFNLGNNLSFTGYLQAVNAFDAVPRLIGYGPTFVTMSTAIQGQYMSDVLIGNFESDGVQDILSFGGIFLLLATKKPEAARVAYEQVLRTSPRDVEALAGLIKIDVDAGRADAAVGRIDQYMKAAKPSVDVLMLAARTYAAAGKADEAEEFLKKAIELDPDRLQAYSLLGRFYARQNRLDEAIVRFRDVLARNPKSVGASTMIGMLLEAKGRPADAEQEYTRVLGVDPQAAVAANNLAWIYVASNRKLDEALQLAQAAQQQLPDEPNVNDTLGWIYYRKNMASQAVTYLENATKRSPNEPSHHLHLGMAYVQTGDWAKARAALNRALTLKPELGQLPETKKALAMIGA
jgi:tetratricopeptide (TPR) repeat protein